MWANVLPCMAHHPLRGFARLNPEGRTCGPTTLLEVIHLECSAHFSPMGVKVLWQALQEAGLVQVLNGPADMPTILHQVEGHAVAVDITIWMCEAMTQPALKEVFTSNRARVLKVCFDRVGFPSFGSLDSKHFGPRCAGSDKRTASIDSFSEHPLSVQC